jgi:hypothetical protein
MTTFEDAPGGAQLIKSLTEAVKKLSLLYAYTPDEEAKAHLQTYIDKIQPELTEAVGAGTAAKLLAETIAVATWFGHLLPGHLFHLPEHPHEGGA